MKVLFKDKQKKLDLLILLTLTLSAPLFFYKLGQSSLVSWDEAWYASISRNITKTGDIFNLIYNGHLFVDQPPGGFWVSALVFKIFGVSELSARFPSAITAILSLYIVYFLGKILFGRAVGFASAISMLSSFWFLYRARTGNLDSILTMSFLLTIYLAILASANKKFFIPFSLSLGFLFVVKSLLPFAVIPALVVIFWHSKYKIKDFMRPAFVVFLTYGIWLISIAGNSLHLLYWHFFYSTRRASIYNNLLKSLNTFLTYLHNGIGKWYWPGLLGTALGILLNRKRFMILVIFGLSYSLPLLFSPEIQIWHLIPLYPIMILLFYGTVDTVIKNILEGKSKMLMFTAKIFVLFFSFLTSFVQLRAAWYQFIDIPAYISDEAILSREAGNFVEPFFIDGDFDPTATFYADRPVTQLQNPDLNYLFEDIPSFLLITYKNKLEENDSLRGRYVILKSDRDKVLIKKMIVDVK